MMAARESRFDTVELLLSRRAEVNRRNEQEMSALDFARRRGDEPMIERLRRAGARE